MDGGTKLAKHWAIWGEGQRTLLWKHSKAGGDVFRLNPEDGDMQDTLIYSTLAALFLASPVILATIVALAKPAPVLAWVDEFDTWVLNIHPTYHGKTGYAKRVFCKPVLWAFEKIVLWTQEIKNDFVRCGVRIASYMYVGGTVFGATAYVAIIAITVVLAIAAVIAGVFLVLLILGAILRE